MTQILEWSEALSLELPQMDETHQEFVRMLGEVGRSEDAQLLQRFEALIDHTDGHFGQEDRWMEQTGFAASNCHSMQHRVVLQVMREGLRRGQAGDLPLVRQMAAELGLWFPQHAQSMDAALALHVRRTGFDPLTGELRNPDAMPGEMIQGCGGSTCSDPAELPRAVPETASA